MRESRTSGSKRVRGSNPSFYLPDFLEDVVRLSVSGRYAQLRTEGPV